MWVLEGHDSYLKTKNKGKEMTKSIISTPLVMIGFGSQARAWALNLRDSGQQVVVALREGSPSSKLVSELGFEIIYLNKDQLPKKAPLLLLIPDHHHEEFLTTHKSQIEDGTQIVYAHGYSLIKSNFQDIFPSFSHLLLAPKAIASEVRFQFETKGKLGAVYSTECALNLDADKEFIFSLSRAIGITAGPYEASFEQEAYADLFSEQGLLCGLIPYAALACYNKLREKNIPKEVAYMECWLETKLICDAMVKMGPEDFFNLISPNALIGGEKARKQLLSDDFLKSLDGLMADIWDKKFFDECDNTDFNRLQTEVLDFWKNQELSSTHNELSKDLF